MGTGCVMLLNAAAVLMACVLILVPVMPCVHECIYIAEHLVKYVWNMFTGCQCSLLVWIAE